MARYGLPPLDCVEAWATYDTIVSDDRIQRPSQEPPAIEHAWRDYSDRRTSSPKLWMDAYLAAFAKVSGQTIVTTDSAFTQFEGLNLQLIAD